MRTTVTIDEEVYALLRNAMAKRDLSFKEALNEALRAGLVPPHERKPFRTKTYNLGVPRIDLDRANDWLAEHDEQRFRDISAQER